MTTTQIALVCGTVLVAVAIVFGRAVSVTFHGIRDIKATVGKPNGNGDLATMSAQLLDKVDAVKQQLEDRTHVTRAGSTEPEELAPYTQERLHDILGAIARVETMVAMLWRALKDDYNLPDLPSMEEKR